MSTVDSFVQGTVIFPESKEELAQVFIDSGIHAAIGQWALRLFEPPSRFEVAYVGNITPEAPFEISVDGYGIPQETVAQWCDRVAGCLRANGIRFDMTHFTSDEQEIREYKA